MIAFARGGELFDPPHGVGAQQALAFRRRQAGIESDVDVVRRHRQNLALTFTIKLIDLSCRKLLQRALAQLWLDVHP